MQISRKSSRPQALTITSFERKSHCGRSHSVDAAKNALGSKPKMDSDSVSFAKMSGKSTAENVSPKAPTIWTVTSRILSLGTRKGSHLSLRLAKTSVFCIASTYAPSQCFTA